MKIVRVGEKITHTHTTQVLRLELDGGMEMNVKITSRSSSDVLGTVVRASGSTAAGRPVKKKKSPDQE